MRYLILLLIALVAGIDICCYDLLSEGYNLTLWPVYGINIKAGIIVLAYIIDKDEDE